MSQLDDDVDRLDFYEDDERNEVRCKFCRARDLHWEEARDEHNRLRWVLMEEDDTIHVCPNKRAALPSDFEDLDAPSSKR